MPRACFQLVEFFRFIGSARMCLGARKNTKSIVYTRGINDPAPLDLRHFRRTVASLRRS
jgi:hypothetical protein